MFDGISKVRCSMARRGETRKTILSKILSVQGLQCYVRFPVGRFCWPVLALFSNGLRDLRLRGRGAWKNTSCSVTDKPGKAAAVCTELDAVERGKGRTRTALPGLRGGHAAAQAAAPPRPVPGARPARAGCWRTGVCRLLYMGHTSRSRGGEEAQTTR